MFKFILTVAILFFFVTMGKTQCVLDGDWQSIDATCPTSSDGAICCDTLYGVVPGTGLPPYACSISPAVGNYNATTNCFENLPVGTYTVTTTSSDGCIGVFTNLVVMSTYAEISATFNITPASCGASDGSICATVTGGSGSFSYNWTGPPSYNTTLSTTNCLSGVPAGIYQLFIDDLNSICSRQYSRTISSAVLTATATATAANCADPCNGSILVDLSSTIAPVTISWSGTSSGSVAGISGSEYLITGLCQGTYSVTVDDASSCAPVVLSGQTIGLNTSDIIVNGCNNPIWNPDHFNGQNDVTLGGNLIIMPGACLVIEDMTIRLRENCSIQVRSGGSVNAHNSTFDNGCGNWWLGFRVEGAATPCDALSSRGLLYLEDCTVTSAIQGVANFRETIIPYSMSNYGGRITALNTTFVDNSRDVDLRNHAAPTLNPSDNYTGFFDECQFLTDNIPIGNSSQISTRIFLSAIDDARFRSCTAINTNLAMWNASGYLNTALTCQASAFQWIGNDVSVVTGFRRGIQSNGLHVRPDCSPQGVRITNITGTEFECAFGIYFGDVGNINILDNRFEQQPTTLTPNSLNYEAIQLKSTLASNVPIYFVRDNVIDYQGTNVGANNYINGINIDNCKGNSNYVLRNIIRFCSVGLWYQGINRNSAASGAHFECNTFVGNSLDVQVTCSGVNCGALSGIAKDQADTWDGQPFNRSARNNFSLSIFPSVNGNNHDDIRTSSTPALPLNGFKYTYLQQDFNPQNFDAVNLYPSEASIGDANIEPYATQNAPFNIVEPILDYNTEISNFCEQIQANLPSLMSLKDQNEALLTALNQIKTIYQQMLDGGSTQELKQNVESATYSQAIELFDELMQLSPALSEEVMFIAIQKEMELPAPLLTAILSANPSAAKNLDIWKSIEERSVPLDAYQKSQIRQGYFVTSIKESLEDQMNGLLTELENNFSLALRVAQEYGEEDVISSLSAYLDLSNYEHQLLAGSILLSSGNAASGYDMLSQASDSNPDNSEIIMGTAELLMLQQHIVSRENTELTTEEKSYLFDIRDNDPCYLGPFAQTLLEIYGGEHHVDLQVSCNLMLSTKSANSRQSRSVPAGVFPNPIIGDYTTLHLNEAVDASTVVELYSINGKLLQSLAIQEGQQEIAIWMNQLPSGVYFLKVEFSNQPFTTSIVKL